MIRIHSIKSIGSLLAAVALCCALGSCSSEDALDATQAVTRNADGSFTIRALSNVALPGGFTQATMTGTSSSAQTRAIDASTLPTGEAIEEKTSWTVGDRLHITYYPKGNNSNVEFYRYATLQADGTTWLLNDAMNTTSQTIIYADYLGKKYNNVDFNDENSGPTGTNYKGNSYNNTTASDRLDNMSYELLYKPIKEGSNIQRYCDILQVNDRGIRISPEGTFDIKMYHWTLKIAITSIDVSAFGSGIQVTSIAANIYDGNKEYFSDFSMHALTGNDQPSTSAPWYTLINPYPVPGHFCYLKSFTVSLSDGREVVVNVPDSDSGFGQYIYYSIDKNLYAYRLILGPGSATATPDDTFTAPGWTAGTMTYTNKAPDGYTAIYTRADLEAIQNNLAGNYMLMNDIDLSGKEWVPIGKDGNTPFTGKLNGCGHHITGLKITGDYNLAALFGVTSGGIIYNLHITNPIVTPSGNGAYAAAIVASNGGYISNCSVTGGTIGNALSAESGSIATYSFHTIHCWAKDCKITAASTDGKAGGLVSKSSNGIIASYTSGCTCTGGVCGGITATENTGTAANPIFGCYALAPTLSGTTNGIIIGSADNGGITSCYGTNASEATSTLIGQSAETTTVTNCVESNPAPTDWSALVKTGTYIIDIPTVVCAADGTLSTSTVNPFWFATEVWGKTEGTTITTRPNINWSYNGTNPD